MVLNNIYNIILFFFINFLVNLKNKFIVLSKVIPFFTWGLNRKPNFWFFGQRKNVFRKDKRKVVNKFYFRFLVLAKQLRFRRFFDKLKDCFKNFIFKRKFLCTQFCMGKQKNFFKFCLQVSLKSNFNYSKCTKLFYLFVFRPAYSLLFVKFVNWIPISNLLLRYGYLSINGKATKNRNVSLKLFDTLTINLLVVFFLKRRFKSWIFKTKRSFHRNFEVCRLMYCLSIVSQKISDKVYFTKFNYLVRNHLKHIN